MASRCWVVILGISKPPEVLVISKAEEEFGEVVPIPTFCAAKGDNKIPQKIIAKIFEVILMILRISVSKFSDLLRIIRILPGNLVQDLTKVNHGFSFGLIITILQVNVCILNLYCIFQIKDLIEFYLTKISHSYFNLPAIIGQSTNLHWSLRTG